MCLPKLWPSSTEESAGMRGVRLKHRTILLAALFLACLGICEAVPAQQRIAPFRRKIVGGEPTEIEKHPWQVALQLNGGFFCGGSIIAQKWILTAAHCFDTSTQDTDWRAKAGVTNHAAA